ncbi:MAG: mannose-1-phosphate guanylyltransferase, partial [Clostridium neonatale]
YEILKSIETINDYDDIYKYLSCNYKYCDDISIDYAVLEKSQNIKVIKCDFGWDDIGTWNAVERHMKKDKDFNIIDGNISMIDSRNNILISNNKNKIVTYGIEGLVCLDTNGLIVITTKERIEDISKIREII